MATPKQILDTWDFQSSAQQRKEVYEGLLGVDVFGDFLNLMKEYRESARKAAQYEENSDRMRYYLGSATAIDEIIDDIKQLTEIESQ